MIRSLLLIVSLIAISTTVMAKERKPYYTKPHYTMTCYYGPYMQEGRTTLLNTYSEGKGPLIFVRYLDGTTEEIAGRDCGFKRYKVVKPEAEKFEKQ